MLNIYSQEKTSEAPYTGPGTYHYYYFKFKFN